MNLTDEKCAYIAGFLEGDGSFQVMRHKIQNKKYAYEYRISGYNTNEAIMEWLISNVGGTYKQIKTSERHKKPFHWNIKTKQAIKLAEHIYPFLVSKKEEVSLWLKAAHFISDNCTRSLTADVIDQRVGLINQIRSIRNENIVTKDNCILYKQLTKSIEPTETDFCFLAGFVDAEGCFRLHKLNKRHMIHPAWASVLEIGNTNALIFPWLMTRFGGNITFIKTKNPKGKPYGVWYVMSSQLRRFIHILCNYLIIKKPVSEKIIEFDATILTNGGDRHSTSFKERYAATTSHREAIFAQIQILNTKGHH